MKIEEVNRYLTKLEGEGYIESLDTNKATLLIKFCGCVGGPYDDGEIELVFHDVEIVNLPLTMVLPARLEEVESTIGQNKYVFLILLKVPTLKLIPLSTSQTTMNMKEMS